MLIKRIVTHRDLIVWQRAMQLVVSIYELTVDFPKDERYGITSQMRRSAISIPSNIAEGRRRGTKRDYLHFLRTAYGSGAELETQLEIAERLSFVPSSKYQHSRQLLDEVMRMLHVLIKKLNPSSPNEANCS